MRVMRNWKIHCIRPNYQSARSKWYDECFAKDLGGEGRSESSQVKCAVLLLFTMR